jgi:AcrR family transcriptional regulator
MTDYLIFDKREFIMERKPSEERKAEIIDAALNLLMEEGMQSLTIKNISSQNHISEAAIYRHFSDKHAILMALVDVFEENLLHTINYPLKNYRNPLKRLKEIMRSHMLFTEKSKGVLFTITGEAVHCNDDELRQKILNVIELYKSEIKKILQEAKAKGLVRKSIDLDAVSLSFFGLIQTAIIQYTLTNYTLPPVYNFNTMWKLFLNGIMI